MKIELGQELSVLICDWHLGELVSRDFGLGLFSAVDETMKDSLSLILQHILIGWKQGEIVNFTKSINVAIWENANLDKCDICGMTLFA